MVTHHKLLLIASHTGAPLGVLVSPDEQLDQSGDGALLTQSTVVGWTKSQVADETDCGLELEKHCSWLETSQFDKKKKKEMLWLNVWKRTLMSGQWDGGCSSFTTTGRP